MNPGQLVALSSWNSGAGLPTGILSDNTVAAAQAMYVVVDAIANGADGYVYPLDQLINGVNVGAAAVGDPVFLSTAGGFAFTTAPTSGRVERIGIVTATGASGSIYLFPASQRVLQKVSYLEIQDGSIRADALQNPTTVLGQITGAGFRVIRAHYSYAVAGGAIGTIALLATVGGLGATPIPSGFMAVGGVLDVTTLPTSGGSATMALQFQTAGDLIAATAYNATPWSAITQKAMPAFTVPIKGSAARDISLVIAGAALTAGVFDAYIWGFDTD